MFVEKKLTKPGSTSVRVMQKVHSKRRCVKELTDHNIRISMTERHDPTGNAVAERMNGILKTEWIYHQEVFKDREQAQDGIAEMIRLYNCVRPHMSIGDKTPMWTGHRTSESVRLVK